MYEKSSEKRGLNKKAQVTIFIIIGLLIVASVTTYILIKNKNAVVIPEEFRPVEEYFVSCMQDVLSKGINLAEEQAGYVELPEFEAGSSYMPTSNMLDFFGTPVPFWYYVSGNNIIKEQVPTKQEIERQLSDFVEKNSFCDFSEFRKKGFEIELGNVKVTSTEIKEEKVLQNVNAELKITRDNKTIVVKNHKVEVKSKFGKFFDTASRLYENEKSSAFLENYTLDILYLYAPVSGVELSCSPKVWLVDNVTKTIKEAIKNNLLFIRPRSDYYKFRESEKYFILNFKSDEAIRFLYSEKWPTKISVEPESNGVIVAEPVGNQPGLGVIGFCYVPYHFVYDLVVPVMIQIYDENEFFQFPVVVVIKRNMPREAINSESFSAKPEICSHKTKDILIYTYDENLNPVSAKINFKCLNEICDIGETEIEGEDAVLYTKVPACVNGFLIAEADGYKNERYQISTNEESAAYIVMSKLYKTKIELKSEGNEVFDKAIIYFISDDYAKTVSWPDQKYVELPEGSYNISIFVYKNESIFIPESKTRKCVDVAKGISGMFGITREECFDVVIPSQTLNNVVVGGGKISEYLTRDELERGISIDVGKMHVPKNIEELQENYNLIDIQKIKIT